MNDIHYIYSRLLNWKNSSPFYDSNLHDNSNEHFYSAGKINDDWNEHSDYNWHYVMNIQQLKNLPNQGWKIHITANIGDAQELLYDVSAFLLKKQISFKFIPSVEQLKKINSKYANRAESGKFITIYPENETEFLSLLNPLKEITDVYEEGPYILNDKAWKQSHVFFRYGAFKRMMFTDENGRRVAAIKDPNGNLVEDMRVPYYYLPSFVKEPEQIEKDSFTVPDSELQEFNKYKIDSVLHFSNGGGVYKAAINGKACVLKEGRRYAGLDAHGLDGYHRISREFSFLNRLSDIDEVVSAYKTFTAWKSNYLVEDFVDGVNLDAFCVENYPLIRDLNDSKEQGKKYNQQVQSIISQLVRVISQAHEHGVAFGDLQPANVIFSANDNSIKLIDLESAAEVNAKYEPGLQTLGYVPRSAKTFGEVDWYALKCIAYTLYMPALVSPSLAPNIYIGFKVKIRQEFGESAIKFLNSLDETIARHIDFEYDATGGNLGLSLPTEKISNDNISDFVRKIFKGIINNVDPKSLGLIKGTYRQHSDLMSEYEIATGGFGGIMALEKSGCGTIPSITEKVGLWVKRVLPILQKMPDDSSNRIGLFDGLSGICSVLYDMGFKNESLSILSQIKVDVETTDYTIFSGLSGIGLVYLAFYSLTKDKRFLNRTIKIANVIINDENAITRAGNESGGLLDGWSGVALFLSTLGNYIDDCKFEKFSVDLLNQVLETQLDSNSSKFLMVKDVGVDSLEGRVFPYLSNGSVGVALAILELKSQGNEFINTDFVKNNLKKLIQTGYSSGSVFGGLLEGYAGFVILANAVDIFNNDSEMLYYVIEGLNSYFVGYNDAVLVPSDIGFKCSMDFSRGASGVLVALSDVGSGNWNSWLPLPSGNGLSLFQSKTK